MGKRSIIVDLPHNGPGRSRLGTFGVRELEAFVKKPGGKDWGKAEGSSMPRRTTPSPSKRVPMARQLSGPVAYLIDGKDETTWTSDRGIGPPQISHRVAVVQFEASAEFPGRKRKLKIAWRTTDMLGLPAA